MAEHGPNKSQHFGYERDIAPLRLTVYRMAAMVRYWSTFLYLTFSLLDATVGPEMKRTTRSIRAGRSLVDSGTTDGAVAALPPPPLLTSPYPPTVTLSDSFISPTATMFLSFIWISIIWLYFFFFVSSFLFESVRQGRGWGVDRRQGGRDYTFQSRVFFRWLISDATGAAAAETRTAIGRFRRRVSPAASRPYGASHSAAMMNDILRCDECGKSPSAASMATTGGAQWCKRREIQSSGRCAATFSEITSFTTHCSSPTQMSSTRKLPSRFVGTGSDHKSNDFAVSLVFCWISPASWRPV